MPSKKTISKTTEDCLSALTLVVSLVSSKRAPSFGLNKLHRLLSWSLARLKRLAVTCGISVAALLAIGTPLESSADQPKFKSSIPLDFDFDGDADIIDLDDATGSLNLIRNNGLNFSKELIHNPSFPADLVAAADMDNDGDTDLVLLDSNTGQFGVLKNQGSEVFVPQAPISLGTPVEEAILADLNQDELPDVVFGGPGIVGWAKNNGTEQFVPQTLQSGIGTPSA